MASVPLSGTDIRLLKGIPFSSDKKHTRWFDSINEQTTYFLSKPTVHTMVNANFQRVDSSTFISVNKSTDELYGTNYVMFRNEHYDKWFYGFVDRIEYVQRNTSYVHFKLDVFQTWCFHMIFNPSYVLREHRPQYYLDGRPVLNTIDEGLDYGLEYETMEVTKVQPNGQNLFLVMVSKSAMHVGKENKIEPMNNATPQPLSYYVHPFKLTGEPGIVTIGGEGVELTPMLRLLKSAFMQTTAINNIVSLYVTDDIGIGGYNELADTFSFSSATIEKVVIQSDENSETMHTLYIKDHSTYTQKLMVASEDKYSGYKTVKESKLLMYPYTTLLLDDFKGNRVELKNELIQSQDIKVRTIGSLGVSNKVAYQVADYLYRDYDNLHGSHVAGLENAVINNNAQDLPIISDYLSAYLQGNKNSLENQKSSIVFNGAMGMLGSVSGGVNKGNVVGVGMETASGLGNTVLQLQGMNAKIKDITNTPPTLAKMGSNTHFDFGNKISGVYLVKKQITQEYINKLTDFFNMYGYKTNEVKIPYFHTRKYWNYVQTSSCVIRGNIASEDLNELKSTFDNGITLWHTDEIGNYHLNNDVL